MRVCWFSNFGSILILWNASNFGFPAISRRTHRGNGLKFFMLMYLDHHQNWLVYSHGLLMLQFWCYFNFVRWVKFGGSGHFSRNSWREWPENLHADLSWPLSEPITLWSWSESNFGAILKQVKFGVSGHFLENLLRKLPEILHADVLHHLQNWLDYGHSLLIFLMLVLFSLSEMGQIWGFRAILVMLCDFPHYGALLTEAGRSYLGLYLENVWA